MKRYSYSDPVFLIHVLIGLVLLSAPIMAWLMGADGMMIGLLVLPVLGWGYLGIWKAFRSDDSGEDQ